MCSHQHFCRLQLIAMFQSSIFSGDFLRCVHRTLHIAAYCTDCLTAACLTPTKWWAMKTKLQDSRVDCDPTWKSQCLRVKSSYEKLLLWSILQRSHHISGPSLPFGNVQRNVGGRFFFCSGLFHCFSTVLRFTCLNSSLQRFDSELVSAYEISLMEAPPIFNMFDTTLECKPLAKMFQNTFNPSGEISYMEWKIKSLLQFWINEPIARTLYTVQSTSIAGMWHLKILWEKNQLGAESISEECFKKCNTFNQLTSRKGEESDKRLYVFLWRCIACRD